MKKLIVTPSQTVGPFYHFALDRPEASAAIVGVTSAAELRAIIAASHQPSPRLDWTALSLDDTAALDPRTWAAPVSSAA